MELKKEKLGLTYCGICDKDVKVKIKEEWQKNDIKGTTIKTLVDHAYCSECKNELYVPDISDETLRRINRNFRKETGTIYVEEIEELLKKYSIGAKPLSLLLGWGECTITRYLKGKIPTKLYSDELKRLKDNNYMRKIFEQNSGVLTNIAKRKVGNTLIGMNNITICRDKKQIDVLDLASFFLTKIDDNIGASITHLKLQKLIYYAQGWHYAFFGCLLFDSPIEAWIHGPVVRRVYDKYKPYQSNNIGRIEFDYKDILDADQIRLLDKIYEFYGSFDASALRNMTHKESPWRLARGGYEDSEYSEVEISNEEIKNYFKSLAETHKIDSIDKICLALNASNLWGSICL